jgi:hypothetical protein
MRHLSRIVGDPYGVNILGLVEMFSFVGILAGTSAIDNQIPRILGALVLSMGFVAPTVFDLWWRIRQPERSVWVRLFSPFTGGCFIYIPIWLVFAGGFVAGVVAILTKITRS